jgi:hypothetical protein
VTKEELSKAHEKRVPRSRVFRSALEDPGAGARRAALREQKKRFWTIYVENILADPMPDLWVELYRFRGHARLRGAFLLHPHTGGVDRAGVGGFLTGRFELALRDDPRFRDGRVDGKFDTFAPTRSRRCDLAENLGRRPDRRDASRTSAS